MTKELLLTILSSSLISTIIVALITGLFRLRVSRNEYVSTYHKVVLDRRISAYEDVEHLITKLRVAVVDNDQRPYHLLFSKDDDHLAVYELLYDVMSNSLWLSDQLYDSARELNVLIYSHTENESGLIEFGKNNYRAIADLRVNLERYHARDMLTLYDIPGFLKSKKHVGAYEPLPRRS